MMNRYTRGRYRKQMRRVFDESLYHQRNKCEAIFSVIKRRFGSEIKSYNESMKEKESLYRILAYNYHRMGILSALLWMMSRKPIFVEIVLITLEEIKAFIFICKCIST